VYANQAPTPTIPNWMAGHRSIRRLFSQTVPIHPRPPPDDQQQPQRPICAIGRQSRLRPRGGGTESMQFQFSKVARLLYDLVVQSRSQFTLRLIHFHIEVTAQTAFLLEIDSEFLLLITSLDRLIIDPQDPNHQASSSWQYRQYAKSSHPSTSCDLVPDSSC